MADDVFGIVGSVVAGAYHIEGVIADGGLGVIYLAHHDGSSAPVALKLLKVPVQSPKQGADFLELLRAEAELMFRLCASLPTVVRPLHVDAFLAADGRFVPYMAMEWLDGLTLDALIKQRDRAGQPAIALRKLVRLLKPVARALERAHQFSGRLAAVPVAHGDLKPENIFIARVAGKEVVRILNFGMLKLKSAAGKVAVPIGRDVSAPVAFTPGYGAPEQWAPRQYGHTGPRTDVWALALCIVETLAARPVIVGEAAAMMRSALDPNRRPTPRREGVDVSDAVEAVFARALALDPRARQPDAGVFWNELTAALQVPEAERGHAAPYDARVERTPASRIELLELPSSAPSSAPRIASRNPAMQRALALDLEFDLTSSSAKQLTVEASRSAASALSMTAKTTGAFGQHFVPDLELTPVSVSRRPSGARPIEQPTGAAPQPSLLDLDQGPEDAASLDLDLHPDEPLARRAASSPRMAAIQLPTQRQSARPPRSVPGSLSARRDSTPEVTAAAKVARGSVAEWELGPNSASGTRPPRPASVPPPASTSGAAFDPGFAAKIELNVPAERPLLRRLRPAFVLLGAAVLIAILDPLYASGTGELWRIIGLRSSIFGGALLVLALGWAAREALRAPSAGP